MKLRAPAVQDLVFVAPLLCFGFAWLMAQFAFFDGLEWRTLDWRTRVRAEAGQPAPNDKILVVGIGDRSTNNIEPWPFRRAYHAQLQMMALHEKPRVWVWDVIFANRVDRTGVSLDLESDLDFTDATVAAREANVPVVFAAVSSADPTGDDLSAPGLTQAFDRIEGPREALATEPEATLPFPGLRENGYFGTVDAPRGAGGIVREMPMLVRLGDRVYPSLTLQTAMCYWKVDVDEVRIVLGDGIYLGPKADNRRIPINARGQLLVNYRYEKMEPDDPIGIEMPTIEYFDQMVALFQTYVAKEADVRPPVSMDGKIVMVGEFSTDAGPSPRADLSPLVLLHANVLNNILESDYVQPTDPFHVWGGALIVGYAGILLLRRRSIFLMSLFTVAALLAYTWFTFDAWIEHNRWIPLAAPLLGFVILQFVLIVHRVLVEQSSKAQLRSMFGSYLSPVVIQQMVDSGKNPELGGMEAEITAYFSDIQSFSAFSEVLPPRQLVALLNEYLTACTDIIREQGGTLDKYIGDAVVAMFGAPVPLEDHAYRACLTSILVQEKLEELRAEWIEAGDKWPAIVRQMRTRIGLNTGECMIGNMGSRTRFDYTMMGDNVNLAARMESGAKSWGVFNMVTEETRRACEQHGGDSIVFRSLGKIVVKGRTQAVPIHEVIGRREKLTAETLRGVALFERGLARYLARDWMGASALFEQSAKLERLLPGDAAGVKSSPSLVYLDIVAEMAEHPPGPNWDGVYTMTDK
ncbi:adenylate/guanylate cyclase domain-containing protein [Synoicihabitans lomoniglobus]|uniref:Adenylate/guanylate cyclase domain-containing protein n=1 Tax=Synoicihabitans lomoniglobus TaxID=2909285 RepID=A0AAF0CQK2_9BACT|nr:adenylate/guanylate cyclase domain-containing protein [Opitutaceae bacterium LMO-M01]WED66232.1 adenylate/guanylate cyclase domain-containing protein [Opitutaceae bacterium LMO-M01]